MNTFLEVAELIYGTAREEVVLASPVCTKLCIVLFSSTVNQESRIVRVGRRQSVDKWDLAITHCWSTSRSFAGVVGRHERQKRSASGCHRSG
jgi:hypothetical protein